jgi:hypothetical protein
VSERYTSFEHGGETTVFSGISTKAEAAKAEEDVFS